MAASRSDITRLLEPFGAPAESVIALDGELGPQHLPHLDLRPRSGSAAPLVDAVVEMQRRPVLYVVRGPKSTDEIQRLCHRLAQRGAADHLGIIKPGELTIVSLLPASKKAKSFKTISAHDEQAAARIPSLALALTDGKGKPRSPFDVQARGTGLALHNELVKLLDSSISQIGRSRGVDNDDALSLVGRALFVRFLIDRCVISDHDIANICPGAPSLDACMDSPARIQHTCRWLDRTFNGDLLPLSHHGGKAFWAEIAPSAVERICNELSKILHKTEPTGQLRFEWATLDFGHIPVGLLSEVYEKYYHEFNEEEASLQSVHYTPRAIAEYMVDEALFELPRAHRARILDPAVGAGVFLVAALRALVAARWEVDGRRPGTAMIREILYRQLVGFDINETALRLTALSLYLAALEIDPSPQPLAALRFENLRGNVLFDVRTDEDREGQADKLPILGSLGPHISARHRAAYDVVLGNPPWTSWKRPKRKHLQPVFDARIKRVEEVVQQIVGERLGCENEFEMVDHVPDVPFCWRATEWARPGGRVALALHGRLLFKRSEPGERVRNLLFRGMRVTGILNGTAVRESKVWPSVKSPFCLWFAENREPRAGDTFNLVSPVEDRALNSRGHLRIDASDAQSVECHTVPQTPWLLKTLFRGTALDVSVMRRLQRPEYRSLLELLGDKIKIGYQLGTQSKRPAPEEFYELKDYRSENWGGTTPFRVNAEDLEWFCHQAVERSRDRADYRAPLVLVARSRGNQLRQPRAVISWSDIAYSKTFYGISNADALGGELLTRYLHIVLNSDICLYFALMQSGQFGVERYVLEQQDLERLPMRRLESLDAGERARIHELSERVLSCGRPEIMAGHPWEEINETVGALYGLNRWDMEVIADTLEVSLPYKVSRDRAEMFPTDDDTRTFAHCLELHMTPIIARLGRKLVARIIRAKTWEPWVFLRLMTWPVSATEPRFNGDLSADFIDLFTAEADQYGATRIVHRGPPGMLTIGIFAQYRYWTRSRARLLALDLLHDHEATLLGEGNS
jgi:hypothetical protein